MSKILLPFPKMDRLTLVANQSLVLNDGPEFVNRVHKHTNTKIDKHHLESFGLFDSASPNFVQYYPDVTTADLTPRPEDYVYPIFRCLSEVIVRKSYDPIDFTKNGVLKASMNKLLGQSIYPNHESLIGNELGVVSKVFWDEAYEIEGVKIPAGINAEFKIDGKSHPNIARAVTSDPPSIHSNSVTVNFLWEQSHPKMSSDEFRSKAGTFDEKGQLIRRIASEIVFYNETSFVPHGADPFAQRVKDGKINNPKYAETRDSFTDNDGRERRVFAFSYKEDLAELTEQTILKNNNISNNDNENPNKMDKALILLFAQLAGITIPAEQVNLSEEDFQAQFDHESFTTQVLAAKPQLEALKAPDADAEANLQALKDEVKALKDDKVVLEKFKTDNEGKITLTDKVHAAKLANCKRLYALTGKNDDTMLSKLEAASFETLEILEAQYNEQLQEKFPATCQSCGGQEISMGSASAEDAPTPRDKSQSFKEVTNRLRRKGVDLKYINGQ